MSHRRQSIGLRFAQRFRGKTLYSYGSTKPTIRHGLLPDYHALLPGAAGVNIYEDMHSVA